MVKVSVGILKMVTKGSEINICRGVKQGDHLSPKIFITVLENNKESKLGDKRHLCRR